MDPDPDRTPDSTPFFPDLKDAKKNFFRVFFLKLAHRHIIFSLKNLIFCYNFVLNFILQALPYFSLLNTFMRKRWGFESGFVVLTNGSGSRSKRPKNMRILRIRVPNTGLNKYFRFVAKFFLSFAVLVIRDILGYGSGSGSSSGSDFFFHWF